MAYAHQIKANPHWVAQTGAKELSHLPGTNGLPLFGSTLAILRDPVGVGLRNYERYGTVYRHKAFGQWSVNLMGAEANEFVLFDRAKNFSNEQGWGPILNLLFPRGLMLMDFDAHRHDRKMLSVAFKPEPMRNHARTLNERIGHVVPRWPAGDFRFYPAIKQLSLDCAALSILGLPWGAEANAVNKAFVDEVQATMGVIRIPLPFTIMHKGVKARQFLIDYFTPHVEERRGSNAQDIFTLICNARGDDGELMAIDRILDHLNFLMMAAHDTITSSATSFILMLAQHPEWQQYLREEALSIAPRGQGLNYDDVSRMTLCDMAFKEALRMVPPVPALPRRTLRDIQFHGHHIPAGTQVAISPGFVHKMEEYWPNPHQYDPSRFTPENIMARHKYAWVPFGGGSHMCLGLHFAYLQIKIFTHHFLTHFEVKIDKGYSPHWQIIPIPGLKTG